MLCDECDLAMFVNAFCKPHLLNGFCDIQVEMQSFTTSREVVHMVNEQSHWSLSFGNRLQNFDLVHQTVSYQEGHMG